ncbi:putative ATP/GTP-binding protein [Streptomyces sp. Tu6071]|nr:putative ATP/GTP-binding protein [Streptomyces sp. Tu6071]
MPALVDARVLGPRDDVRDARGDLLVAAGAAVRLAGGARARDVPDRPLLALPGLGPLQPVAVARVLVGPLAGAGGSLGAVAAGGH